MHIPDRNPLPSLLGHGSNCALLLRPRTWRRDTAHVIDEGVGWRWEAWRRPKCLSLARIEWDLCRSIPQGSSRSAAPLREVEIGLKSPRIRQIGVLDEVYLRPWH